MPLAFAVVLSVAAGLSLAEEAIQPPATTLEPSPTAFGPNNKGTPGQQMGSTGWTGASREQTKPGVGSRAITGPEAPDRAADQPQRATGVDLEGPPVRFPAADTPE